MSKERITDIEILRGLAVLGVVIHHARDNLFTWQATWLDYVATYFGGWVGVDLFLAISGFVIARTLLPQLQVTTDTVSAFRTTLAFWIRRAWRLLPSAWLWLLIILVASVIFRESGIWSSPRANLEATVAGILNIANLRFIDTFMHTEYGASFVYWSLSLEEQFYLLLPLIILVSRRFLIPVLLVIALWQLLQERTLAMMAFRSDGLILGVLLAIWSRHPTYQLAKPTFLSQLPLKGTLPLLIIVSCMLLLGSDVLKIAPYRMSWIAILSIILVWVASYNSSLFFPTPIKQLLLWIGARSYAIYLIHIPVFFFTREIWIQANPNQIADNSMIWHYTLTAGVLILLLSEINYRLIEAPLRKRGASLADNFRKTR